MAQKRNLKQWATVFRGLGNQNRLQILEMLTKAKSMSVSELSEKLHITLKNTSRNLGILLNLDLVEFQGRNNRVYYNLNPRITEDIARVLKVLLP